MAMIVAVDIGNTNIVIAVKDMDRWITSFRIFTKHQKSTINTPYIPHPHPIPTQSATIPRHF